MQTDMKLSVEIRFNMQKKRKAASHTQQTAANKLGVSRAWIASVETGQGTNPSVDLLLAMAKLYGISISDLLKEVNQKGT